MNRRTILLGMDGATFYILRPLMDDGVMPNLEGMINSGCSANLRSVIPALTPPAWTSLATGRTPGHHGVFDFFSKVDAGKPQMRFTLSSDIKVETIWSIVNRHGKKATVLNYPVMFPAPAIDGFVVPGWMPWRQFRLGCYPRSLFDRLKTLPGFDAKELAMDMELEERAIEGCRADEYEDWIELHIRRERRWFEVLRNLMTEDPCELTAVVFDGVDKLQHLCWRFIDPAYADTLKEDWEFRVRDKCLRYFRELDELVGMIVELADPETTFVFASDHGFGAQVGTFFVNAWLQQKGYLKWAEEHRPSTQEKHKLGISQLARHEYAIDWDHTLAYAATPSSNGIHIVVARKPGDKGVPEDEYIAFRDRLSAELAAVTDPATSKPVISGIYTRDAAFAGPHAELAPDLTLVLSDGGLVSIMDSEDIFRPRETPSGTHQPEGIFIAKGPGLRQGAQLSELSILDTPPFILHSLGLPVPEDMEGRVPTEAFEDWALEKQPVVKVAAVPLVQGKHADGEAEAGIDERAEQEIMKRLQALGYVD